MSSWQEARDDQGRVYYYNVTTHETSWEKPAENLPTGSWKAYKTEDGRDYYHNEVTGETTWDKPEGFDAQDEDEMKVDENVEVEEETLTEEDKQLAKEKVEPSELEKYQGVPEEEAQELFYKMLELEKVDSTWSFEKVIQTFIKNPSYWAVSDPLKRKQLYDDYLVDQLKLKVMNKAQALESAKANFVQVLELYKKEGKLNRHTRWSFFRDQLIEEENSIFKHSVLGDSELRRIFTEFVRSLAEAEDRELQAKKEEATAELESYLHQLALSMKIDTLKWDKLYETLQNDARFKANKHFDVLAKSDILDLYLAKVYPKIIDDLKKKVEQAEKTNYRADRKAREAFKKLLVNKVTINAGSLFKDVLPQFEDEDEFIEICGRNGSTPLELFWDVVDEKSQLLKVKKDLVEAVVRDYKAANADFDNEAIFSDFQKFVEELQNIKDERLNAFDLNDLSDNGEIRVIYNQLAHAQTLQAQKEKTKFEESIPRRAAELASWLNKNKNNISLLEVLEEDSNAQNKSIILKKGEKYVLKAHYENNDAWAKELEEAPAFSGAQKIANKLYKDSNEEADSHLSLLIRAGVLHLVQELNTKPSRKRLAPDPEASGPKKPKTEEKKPVFINY